MSNAQRITLLRITKTVDFVRGISSTTVEDDFYREPTSVAPNAWDSLMVCGLSWAKAEELVRLYAKAENLWVCGKGWRYSPRKSGRDRQP